MVDTFFGLAVVGLNGGKAAIIAYSANGVKFNFITGCDVNPIYKGAHHYKWKSNI